VYGVVPPVALTVTVVLPPLHAIVPEEAEAVGALMVSESTSVEHPLTDEYVPD